MVVGNIAGEIKLVDTKKGKIMNTILLTKDHQIFDMDWSMRGLFIVSEMSIAFFYKMEGTTELDLKQDPGTFKFESPARSCQWNKLKPHIAAVGTFES